ncbi:transposase [Globicatella sanguinis]|uniref:transposase n=1 Tax=Globicatella sanguinis TaxID=13076 RepID=UPI002542CEB7|nr:transposase [Globicatella sanguinis]WIK66252.1 transposase [Globicatella sanguinis]WIK67186.1 transposase [Globicatella sanguinis]WKT55657.1 transposase [Globicatella sanguinis]WKT56591.1 transposase [Globicatella sanguinis]
MNSLEKQLESQFNLIETLNNEIALLREQNAYLLKQLYGKKSEKIIIPDGQLSLFEDENEPAKQMPDSPRRD